jgi:hypothetical protein
MDNPRYFFALAAAAFLSAFLSVEPPARAAALTSLIRLRRAEEFEIFVHSRITQ